MFIRLWLALCCAGLCITVLAMSGLFSYVFHVRGHYDDLDRNLVENAIHTVSEIKEPADKLGPGSGIEVILRLYEQNGTLKERSLGTETLPDIDPRLVVAAPGGPAFDLVAGLAPSIVALPSGSERGRFGLVSTSEQRWRVYVLPLSLNGTPAGYVEALTSLKSIDAATERFRLILLAFGLFGTVVALVGGGILSGRALRPVARMVKAAQTISTSRNFSHRVEMPLHQDELGQLATTFNQMLESLEEAYRSQQRFISDASHELRAPLTAIQGNLELMRLQKNMSETEREEALAEAEREAARLTRLVKDLLALARADAGMPLKFRRVDLDVVVLEVFHSVRTLAHGQKLILDPFEPIQIVGDEDQLKQLVLILLDNALKYTPAGGQVRLGLRRLDNQVEITVQDTGVGISTADLPHVFERFYRADPARGRDPGGTGLGLAIAFWITQQHGGSIELNSQVGQGTSAKVHLPVRS